jgi:hypothetical protein
MLNTKKPIRHAQDRQRSEDGIEEKLDHHFKSFRLALGFLAASQFISGISDFDLIGQGSRAQAF